MLKRENRFSFKKRLPQKVFATPHFILRYQNEADGVLHAAVVVGKKVDKRAVARNKIKRMIVKNLKELLSNDKNLTLIVFAKKPITELNNEELKENLEKALKSLNQI